MIAHKHITKIIAVIMALAVAACLYAVIFSSQITAAVSDTGVSMEYETELFDTSSIISVNIIMDEDSWNDMLENATAEEYYQCDVEINGTTFYKVAIRPKGNTSLSSIANDPTTDRYSFKLEFDHYVDGQTCFGLDKLVLNNNYADATSMKEALIYDMFQFLGADASLYNYASISVNGEYWGVYLALEAVDDSFQLRNYGVQNGELYKPESMGMGGGDNGGGPGGMNGGGADLNYSDDDLDSYSTIWDGEITNTTDADHQRVVTALKNISEGTDLERYMDIDNLLRYMAVHVFSVNEDSLSGTMAHNYYLYESNGMLNLIPWDYNIALGGMGGGMGGNGATSVVNDPIDNAFSGTDFFDTLMENETYHSQYYAYLQQLVSEYIEGGAFDAFYERVHSQIDDLVANDPTAFYTSDEYQTAAETLYQVVKLRGESIQGQLDGTIPSTESEQRSSDALVDASSINLSSMGRMGGGNDGGGGPGGGPGGDFGGGPGGDFGDFNNSDNSEVSTTSADSGSSAESETTMDLSQFNGMPPGDSNPQQAVSETAASSETQAAATDQSGDESQGNAAAVDESQAAQPSGDENQNTDSTTADTQDGGSQGGPGGDSPGGESQSGPGQFGGDMPGDFGMPGSDSQGSSRAVSTETLILYGASLLVIIAALIFAILYKRRPRRK